MLLSGSGSEGLDLKRTQEIHIMEPHWNQMRIDQVIGRGWRKNAHKNNENKVLNVYQWSTVHPKIISADEVLQNVTKKKEYKNNLFIELLLN